MVVERIKIFLICEVNNTIMKAVQTFGYDKPTAYQKKEATYNLIFKGARLWQHAYYAVMYTAIHVGTNHEPLIIFITYYIEKYISIYTIILYKKGKSGHWSC